MAYNDKILNVIILIVLSFLMLNFDIQTSQIFIVFVSISLFLSFIDKYVRYVTEKQGNNRVMSIVWAIVSYTLFNLLATIALGIFNFTSSETTFSAFNNVLFETFSQATPSLAGVLAVSIAVWGIIIPLVETDFFFGRLFELIVDFTKIPMSRGNLLLKNGTALFLKTLALIALSGGIFVFYHITAKGIENNSALLLVWVFGMVSQAGVIWFGQTLEMKILHVIANSTALLLGVGINTISGLIENFPVIAVLLVPLVIFLLPEFNALGRFKLRI